MTAYSSLLAVPTSVGGVAFTRWGRTNCPSTSGTQLLYQGTVAGSRRDEGGNGEYLCLHQQPQFLRTTSGLQSGRGRLYGTEYEALDSPPAFSNRFRLDAPCTELTNAYPIATSHQWLVG